MTEHLQTDTPIMPFDQWLAELKQVTEREAKLNPHEYRINEAEARQWYDDGFTPYVCFRETFQ